MNLKCSYGGTSSNNVKKMINKYKKNFKWNYFLYYFFV
jgi:hypothetical protein